MGKEVEGKGKAREEGTEEGCVREGKGRKGEGRPHECGLATSPEGSDSQNFLRFS